MTLLLLLATASFAYIAAFSPALLRNFATRRRLRHPHTALLLIFRLWFGALAIATFWLLLHQPRTGH